MNGRNIVKYSKDNGIFQLEFAKRIGVTGASLSN